MTEEQKIDDQAKQELADASMKQIQQIAKMVKEYHRAIYGSINSTELYVLGVNTIMAGLQMISRSNDMDMLDVDTRIATMKATMATIQQVLDKVYLNPEVVAGMVAQAALETAKRDGLMKNKKVEK